MTSPFTNGDLQHPITVLQKKMDEGEPVIALLAAELLQLRQQITPQAELVAWRSVDNTGDYIYSASDTIGGEPLYTAPPRPVCPHIRSSKDGTSWCDLAARVGDLSPVAGET